MKIEGFEGLPLKNNREMIDGIPAPGPPFFYNQKDIIGLNHVKPSIFDGETPINPVQTMTLKFFRGTLVHVHGTKYCILTLISNIPKNHKIPGTREI